MFSLLLFIWIVIRRWLALLWLRLNRSLVQPGRLEAAGPLRHKLLVIGDGYAEGLGDWVQMGSNAGLVRRLQACVAKEERIRQFWRIASLGRAGSVTGDWLNALSDDDRGLLRKNLNRKSYEDAAIVVVCLGTMDVLFQCDQLPLQAMAHSEFDYVFPEDELAVLTKNLIAICEYLRAKGMHVILCDLPQELPGMRKFRGRVKKLNRQIRQYIERRKSEDADDKDVPQIRLVRMSDGALARSQSLAFDGQHLNAQGYKILGEMVFAQTLPLMIKTELPTWLEMMKKK